MRVCSSSAGSNLDERLYLPTLAHTLYVPSIPLCTSFPPPASPLHPSTPSTTSPCPSTSPRHPTPPPHPSTLQVHAIVRPRAQTSRWAGDGPVTTWNQHPVGVPGAKSYDKVEAYRQGVMFAFRSSGIWWRMDW